jgi:NAD(P)-dependent dehydrogenase (short-subunit alcohol dehydrogenase family)
MAPIDQLPPGVIVVSGASRGLGRELVEQLRMQGRPLIAVVRRLDGCGLAPEGEPMQLVEANLATTAGIEAAIAGVLAALGERPLAAVVNGAGTVCPIGPLTQHSSDTLLTALTLMAVAPARLASALAGRLVPGGRVLNLSTRSAFATFPGLSLYCMSKHALHSLSRSLQLELPPTIAVAELIPGEVDTGMQADLRAPDPSAFQLAGFFRANQPNLIPAPLAVAFIRWVLLHTPLATYGREAPWFIYDASLQPHWLPEGVPFAYPEP